MEKHKERKRACVPLQGAVSIETSYISMDDHFAALQIDLCVRGRIDRFGGSTAYTIPFPSVPELCPFNQERFHTPSQRTPFIILFPIRKNKTARKLFLRARHCISHQFKTDCEVRLNRLPIFVNRIARKIDSFIPDNACAT